MSRESVFDIKLYAESKISNKVFIYHATAYIVYYIIQYSYKLMLKLMLLMDTCLLMLLTIFLAIGQVNMEV